MHFPKSLTFAALLGIGLIAGCGEKAPPAAQAPAAPVAAAVNPAKAADFIYFGGDIVTIDDKPPSAEALAVKDGKIVLVGSKADAARSRATRPSSSTSAARRFSRASSTPTATTSTRCSSPTRPSSMPRRPARARMCQHHRRDEEVRRGTQDSQGRNDHGLRL